MKKGTVVLFFLLLAAHPNILLAQRIESSFESKESGSGGQEVHAHTKGDYGTYQIETEEHQTTETSGRTMETQKVTYTGPDGKQYTETHGWEYDPFTEETKEWHRTEGVEPTEIPEPDLSKIDEGGVKVEGEANGDPVETKYGPGGVEDHWPAGDSQWVDVDGGTSGHIDPGDQTAGEVESVPARTIPLICRVSSLQAPPVELGFSPQKLVDQMLKNPEQGQKMMEEMQTKIKQTLATLPKESKQKISVEEVAWKKPPRFWGRPVKTYAIFLGEGRKKKKRADIWTVPSVRVWDLLKGNSKAREKQIEQMLIPHWEGVSLAKQKEIFSSLVVLFTDHAYENHYIAEALERLPQYAFHKPAVPPGYTVEKIDRKQLEAMTKEAQNFFWQGMTP